MKKNTSEYEKLTRQHARQTKMILDGQKAARNSLTDSMEAGFKKASKEQITIGKGIVEANKKVVKGAVKDINAIQMRRSLDSKYPRKSIL